MKLSLEKLQELYPEGKLDRRKKNLSGKCPECGEQSFGISIEDNHLSGCYRLKHCGVRYNIFTLAKKLGRLDLINPEGNVGQQLLLEEKLENKLIKTYIPLDLSIPTIKLPLGCKRIYEHPYLDSRGFTEYERYKVYTTNIDPRLKKNYAIVAIEDEGETKAYIARHVWSKEKIKEENERREQQGIPEILRYRNSDSDFAKILFGFDNIKKDATKIVVLVEGIFDHFNIAQKLKLYDQDTVKSCATFKCAISEEQMYKLKSKGVETLILFYDNDVVKQIKKTASELQLYFNVLIAFNTFSSADAGDISEQELQKVFANLKTPTEFFINRI